MATMKIASALSMAEQYAHSGDYEDPQMVARVNAAWDELHALEARLSELETAQSEARLRGDICKRMEEALGPGAGSAWERVAALKADAERGATLAWNEAVEAAATRLEERAKECWSANTTLSGTMRHVYGEEAAIIRALKRTT